MSGHRPPGYEGVAVALRGAFCMAFFELFIFVGSQRGPKYYMKPTTSLMENIYIRYNFKESLKRKRLHFLKFPIFKSGLNNQVSHLTAKCC